MIYSYVEYIFFFLWMLKLVKYQNINDNIYQGQTNVKKYYVPRNYNANTKYLIKTNYLK